MTDEQAREQLNKIDKHLASCVEMRDQLAKEGLTNYDRADLLHDLSYDAEQVMKTANYLLETIQMER